MMKKIILQSQQHFIWQMGILFSAWLGLVLMAQFWGLEHLLFSLLLLFTISLSIWTTACLYRQIGKTETKLQELDFLKQTLDQHAIVSATDVKGNITYANPMFCQISGYSLNELLGKNHRIVKSDEHAPEVFRQMWKTIANGNCWQGEVKNRRKDGGHYWVSATIVPFLDHKNKPVEYLSIRTDITQQKKIEEQFRQSYQFLQSVMDSLGQGIYVLDKRGICTFANHEATLLLGYQVEELLGQGIHDLIHFQSADKQTLPAAHCPSMIKVRKGEKYHSESQVFTRKNGDIFPVELLSFPIKSADSSRSSVSIFQDISIRKNHEKELYEAKQKAEVANLAKSDFLATMSHEINTPMNVIIGMTNILLDETDLPQQQAYLNKIKAAANTLLKIINDILDFSKLGTGNLVLNKQPFQLSELTQEIINEISPSAEQKNLELNFSIPSQVPQKLNGDIFRIKQLLIHLLSNAIKFTTQGMVELIVLQPDPKHQPHLFTFLVRDTGIGITPTQQQKLFQVFAQADSSESRQYGGVGLGLAFCLRLIKLMDGQMKVHSQIEKGSTFEVLLQLEVVDQEPLAEEPKVKLEQSSARDLSITETLVYTPQLTHAIQSLKELLRTGDTEAQPILHNLINNCTGMRETSAAKRLIMQVDNFEFEQALITLESIEANIQRTK